MRKDIDTIEEKYRKKINAILWKAGYIASKPNGISSVSEGYEISSQGELDFITYHTNKSIRIKMQILIKCRDVLREHGLKADICDESEDPYICV